MAPWCDFRHFADVGWRLHNLCGEPRRPEDDHVVYRAPDYTDAMGEAALRVYGALVPTVIAIRAELGENAFLVAPLADMTRLEADGWEMCEKLFPF